MLKTENNNSIPITDSKDDVLFVMDTMRDCLLYLAHVQFTEMNKNMCINMRALARAALKRCHDRLNIGGTGEVILPLKENIQ